MRYSLTYIRIAILSLTNLVARIVVYSWYEDVKLEHACILGLSSGEDVRLLIFYLFFILL